MVKTRRVTRLVGVEGRWRSGMLDNLTVLPWDKKGEQRVTMLEKYETDTSSATLHETNSFH